MRDHSEMELMLKGYGLTTAKILYHFPDHPHLLQTYHLAGLRHRAEISGADPLHRILEDQARRAAAFGQSTRTRS